MLQHGVLQRGQLDRLQIVPQLLRIGILRGLVVAASHARTVCRIRLPQGPPFLSSGTDQACLDFQTAALIDIDHASGMDFLRHR